MPLAFEDLPGLAERQLRLARRTHEVVATGPSAALGRMIPSLGALPQPDGSMIVALRPLLWLLLPIICPGPDIPIDAKLKSFIVHVSRLGEAFDRLVLAQLDLSPCSLSV